MCRLTVIVPLLNSDEAFEDTLISVLQNRPRDCEVLVVHRGPYEDPYDLHDEVGFIEVGTDADLIRSINAGLRAARGEVLHVLHAGVEAEDGWTEPALEWFDDPMVGAVAPLVLQDGNPSRIASAGVCYTAGGRRLVNGVGAQPQRSAKVFRRNVIGPTLAAAFYRRSAVDALGGLCTKAGTGFADVDIGMSMKALGYRCVLEPDSVAVLHVINDDGSMGFHAGRRSECVFWRYAEMNGWPRSVLCHMPVVIGSLLAHGIYPGAYLHLLGRTVAALGGLVCCRRQQTRLCDAAELLERENNARQESDFGEVEGTDACPPTLPFSLSPRRRAA